MKLDTKTKADIRFFTYYFVNGTLDFDLLNSQLKIYHINFIEQNPRLFFESFCVFINHKLRTPDINPMNKRVAEYICKTIDLDSFRNYDNFENWEINFEFNGDDFANCFKDFVYRITFDKIEKLTLSENYFKRYITYGATFWETVFVIWANNLEIENNKVLNQEHAINRACDWFTNPEIFEDWEVELEM